MEKTFREAILYRRLNIAAVAVSSALFLVNRLILYHLEYPPLRYFCHCYLNDLICPLFFLGASEILLIWIDKEITGIWGLLLYGMSAALIFEFAGPLVNGRSVVDPLDLLFHFVGTCLYAYLLRRLYKC